MSGRVLSNPAKRAVALCSAGSALLVLALLTWVYAHNAPVSGRSVVAFELGGATRAPDYIAAWGRTNLETTIAWDFVFIAGYGLALLIFGRLAVWLAHPESLNKLMKIGLSAAVVAILADLFENTVLLLGLNHHANFLKLNCYDLGAISATVKFCAVVPAVLTALVGLGLALVRGLTFPRASTVSSDDVRRPRPVLPDDAAGAQVAGDLRDGARERWERGFNVATCPAGDRPPLGTEGQLTGIGLSGGGIRAGTLALGVLQSEGMRAVLPHTQYIVSVSGGGYTAGGFAQALTGQDPPSLPKRLEVVHDPATAFLPGSPEEDHLRRHSSYLANNPHELLAALALLGRHLILTLLLLFGPAVVLGVLAGRLYAKVPITELALPDHATTQEHTVHIGFRDDAWWAIGLTAALAAGLWLAAQGTARRRDPNVPSKLEALRRPISVVASGLTGLAVIIAILTFGIPCLVWVSSWLLHATPNSTHVASPIFAVLLTYGASIASVAWRKRAVLSTVTGGSGAASAAPRGFTQILLVILALVVLAAGWLLVFGGMVTVGLEPHLGTSTIATIAVITAVVVFLGVFTDETTLSLHPFYRARLADAFAVRRVRDTNDGRVLALPYQGVERSTLSRHGVQAQPTKFPHTIFGASATLGQQRTPPGYDRVSYTMCAHWVGGPDIGYVRTDKLEDVASPRLQRDLTVQGAVAISGAALAASVSGQGTSWYETLLAISGVRLGAWLPNPRFVIDRYALPRTVDAPGMPRVRRAQYLLRALLGGHPPDGPLLQVTDGGFYDNLGLVELFRRGCTRIYVVDGSGDSPPAATTLAETLTLAYQELGVVTDLGPQIWKTLTPGSAEPLSPADPLADLSARLSATGVATATFSYPDCGPYAGQTGTLVVAKSTLWADLPYPLLTYAVGHEVFPHDSTGDQFFDDKQYAAYTELGRHLGNAAAAAMAAAT